jgi:hypothetical protein
LLALAPMPARMTSCGLVPAEMDHRVTPPAVLRVSFMITGDVAADLVRFTARLPGGNYRTFTTRGNFTKTVMIFDRELQKDPKPENEAEVAPLGHDIDCALTYIHFVDGSSWSAPEP